MVNRKERLEQRKAKLKEEEKAVDDQLKEIKKTERQRERKAATLEKDRKEKADTHRKILMGVAAEEECKTNPGFKKFFEGLLDRFYQRPDQRKALGLPLLPEVNATENKPGPHNEADKQS